MSNEQDLGKEVAEKVQQLTADAIKNAVTEGIGPVLDAAGNMVKGALDTVQQIDTTALQEGVKGLQDSIRALVDNTLKTSFGAGKGAVEDIRQTLDTSIEEFRRNLEATIQNQVAEVAKNQTAVGDNAIGADGVGASETTVTRGENSVKRHQNIIFGDPQQFQRWPSEWRKINEYSKT